MRVRSVPLAALHEHPQAHLVPEMRRGEWDDFYTDIALRGIKVPLEILGDGTVMDGRHRLRAAKDLGLPEVPVVDASLNGDSPIAYMLKAAVLRRHLTDDQRAAMAAMWAQENKRPGQRSDLTSGEAQPEVRQRAAADFKVSPTKVKEATTLLHQAPEVFHAVHSGEVSLRHGKRMKVHYSSETPEWYTPQHIVQRVESVLGAIDLDPCSNPGQPNVPAAKHYTAQDDGLAQAWVGRVYMNPPYGREIAEWVAKLQASFESGSIPEAIALVPARTDTDWFNVLRDHAICFVHGRLKFSENGMGAPFPSCAVYLGNNLPQFVAAFQDIGDVWKRVNA